MTHTRMVRTFFAVLTLPALLAVSGGVARSAPLFRAYVAANTGIDTNPCTLFAQCKTVNRALATIGRNATVTVTENGDYLPFQIKGAVCVAPAQCTQTITVEAAPGIVATIDGSAGDAVYINAGSQDVVVIRGFRIDHQVIAGGVGIGYANAMAVYVEACYITGSNVGIDFVRAAPGPSGGRLFVTDCFFKRNAQGIRVKGKGLTSSASIDHCRFELESTAAIDVEEGTDVVVRDSVFANSSVYALRCRSLAPGVDAHLSIENSSITGTGYGCVAPCAGSGRGILAGIVNGGKSKVWLSNTTLTQNQVGIEIGPQGYVSSFQNNRIAGNIGDRDVIGGALIPLLMTELIGMPAELRLALQGDGSAE